MTNYIQILIGLILISLLSLYRLLMVHGEAGDKKLTTRLKYIIGLSATWAITAFVASFEGSINNSNSWVFFATNKAFNLLALLFAISSYYFIKIFPTYKTFSRTYLVVEKVMIGLPIAMMPLILFSDLIAGSYVKIPANNVNGYTPINSAFSYRIGDLAIPFGIILITILFVTIYVGLSKKFHAKASEKERAQSKTIVLGITSAIMLGTTFQLILPSIIRDYPNSLYTIGQLAPIFITFSAASAVLKYRLFDIRNSAFRALGYSLSIAMLIGIYTILIWVIILPFVYADAVLTIPSFLVVIGGTMTTILLYDRIKSIFDTLTDKLFFKNTYNLTQFLDEFNQALINSSDINELSSAIMKVISENLKSEFIILMIKSGDFEIVVDSRKRKVSTRKPEYTSLAINMIRYYFKTSSRIIMKDYMDREKFESLYAKLVEVNAAVAIDLSESSRGTDSLSRTISSGNFKTMILGPKSNGGSYTVQDLDALKIVSKELVVGLQNSMRFEEIRIFNLDLQRKVDDATVKLRKQNKKLVLADELKDDFLSIASHQMRTPISSILGYSSILSSGDAGRLNKKQIKFAKTMEGSAKRLSYLINDFLTVSRLKSGKFNIEKVKTDLKHTLRSEAKNLESQFKSKEIKFKIKIENKIPIIKADEQKLRQVMMNLIDNAMYYTPQGGEVEVTLKRDGQEIIFEVRDSGIGVPESDRDMLFTKMFRASNAQRMRPDGTGLGLFLTKKVVLGHKGRVIFRSIQGQGSVFGFSIPIKRK
jgi:signal transduction histidine kinase